MRELTFKQRRFVNEYCVDGNGTQAVIRAGYSSDTARQIATELLSKPHIQAAIEERQRDLALAASITPELVVATWAKIALADPNDLVATVRHCCRHCYGFDHGYQWTAEEYRQAVDDAQGAVVDMYGGLGYDATLPPADDCPECNGLGVEDVRIADSRKIPARSKALYAGAKRTKNGIEVLMHDQAKALDNLAKYLGMMVDKKELSGPGGGPLQLETVDMTDAQLLALLNADKATDSE